MNKYVISALLLSASLFAGCVTPGATASGGNVGALSGAGGQAGKTTGGTALQSFFGSLIGSALPFSQNDLTGTWKYAGADCVFETENLLMKAGGELAAAKMESQLDNTLSKVGIRPGSCSFTFNKDNTYSAVIGNRTITGTYTLDTKNKRITMTYLNGLGTMSPSIVRNGSQISLLYEADKLLKLVSTVSALSGNSSMKTLSSLVSSYDGMLIGMQLKK